MAKNNTNGAKPTKRNRPDLNEQHSSATRRPNWSESSSSGIPRSQSSSKKFYTLLALWIVVLTVAVAAVSTNNCSTGNSRTALPEAFQKDSMPSPTASARSHSKDVPVTLNYDLSGLDNSLPSSFRNAKDNNMLYANILQPCSRILATREHPLRVLHIGDSHVAGKTFPTAVRETLLKVFGEANDTTNGTTGNGIEFQFIGSNGATSSRFLSDNYMNRFATFSPDLIILSLGTNEAHGMGYREDLHTQQLDKFFERLRKACPGAAIVLTTPPGDYLTTSYVTRIRASRKSKRYVRRVRYASRPNPMSSRCAELIANYGKEHGMAVWDLYTIAGGEQTAQRNWVTAHLMRADRIHFEPAGYKIHGRLLGNALAKALCNK